MKKLLFLTPKPPYPITDGGRIRSFQSLYFLSKLYKVDILYITDEKDSYEEVEKGLSSYCNNIYPNYISKVNQYLNLFKGLFKNKPLRNNMVYSYKIQKWIDRNIVNYDAVFCQTLRTLDYVINRKNIEIFVDFVDAVSMNYEKAMKKSTFLHSIFYRIDFKRLCKYEEFVLSKIDKCSIISNKDKEYICKRIGKEVPLHVVGNMVNMSNTLVNPTQHDNVITFVGKMNYAPNVVAVNNFVTFVYPELKRKFPSLKLYIVGGSPTKEILKLANDDIIVTGYVDSVYDYYEKASLVVAPMLTGAGIQNKIIQAMSLGCCVVTTSIGAEGLDECKDGLVVVDGNLNMIEEISKLLVDPKRRILIGINGHNYVQNTMSEKIVFNNFTKFIYGI